MCYIHSPYDGNNVSALPLPAKFPNEQFLPRTYESGFCLLVMHPAYWHKFVARNRCIR
jgi:hypothetical protein